METEGILIEISAKTDDLISSLNESIDSLDLFEKAAVAAGVVAAAAFAGNAVKDAADFQSKLAGIATHAGLGAEGIAALEAATARLRDTTVGGTFAQSEIAEALARVAVAGRTVDDAMRLVGSAQLFALASGQDLADATDQMNALLEANPALDAARAVDILTASWQQSTGDAAGWSAALVGATATARTWGLSIEQSAALLAVLKDAGVESLSSVGLSMDAMLDPATNAAKRLASLGVSARDADGKARPFLDVIGDLRAALEASGTTASNAGEMLAEMFGPKVGQAINVVVAGYEDVERKQLAIVDSAGRAASAAESMASTPKAQLDAMRADIGELSTSFGLLLLPAVSAVLDVVMRLFGFIEEHSGTFTALAIGIGAGATALAAYSIAGAASAFASSVAAVGFVEATVAAIGLNVALLPITATILAIAAVVALVAAAWINDWGGIQEKTHAVIAWIVDEGFEWLKTAFRVLLAVLTGGISELVIFLVHHWEDIKAATSALVDFFAQAWARFIAQLTALVDNVRKGLDLLVAFFKDSFEAAWAIVVAVWQSIESFIAAVLLSIIAIFTGNFDELGRIWGAFLARIAAVWSDAWNGVRDFVVGIWLVIAGVLRGAWDTIRAVAVEKFDAIRTVISNAWDAVKNAVPAAWEAVKRAVRVALEMVVDVIRTLVTDGPRILGEAIASMGSKMAELPGALVRGIGDITEQVWSYVSGQLHVVAARLKDWASGILGLSPTLTEIAGMIPGALGRGVGDVESALLDKIEPGLHGVAARVTDAVDDLSKQVSLDTRIAANVSTATSASLGVRLSAMMPSLNLGGLVLPAPPGAAAAPVPEVRVIISPANDLDEILYAKIDRALTRRGLSSGWIH